jgi:hypothetical protein
LDALTEILVRLLKRQEETDKRLARIEGALGIPYEPAAEAAAPPAGPAPKPAPEPSDPRPALESRIGLAWINRIGVVTLILGAAFFFKLAVENRWIGETARAGLGMLCGLAAILAADRLWQRGQAVFAQGISAAGIALLYLAVYAAFGLYYILPAYFAFVLMVAVTAGAAALAVRYGAVAIAALGLFGGYATPLLLGEGARYPWFYLGYVLLLNAAAVRMARRRGWRLLLLLAFLSTVVLFGSWLGQPVERKWTATLFTLLFYGLFAAAPSRPVFYAAQALAPLTLTAIWTAAFAAFLLPLAVIAAAGLVVSDRRGWPSGALITALFTWMAVMFWYGGHPRPLFPVLMVETLLFALFLAWIPWRLRQRGAPAGRAEALLTAVNAGFYFGAVNAPLQRSYPGWLGLFTLALACVHMTLARALWNVRTAGLMLAGVAWILLILAVPIQFAGFTVTILWALQGAALAWVGMRLGERPATWGAVAVFAAVVIRLAGVDAGAIETPALSRALLNPRFLAFAVSGASMMAAAHWMRAARRRALVLYVAGHAVVLWGMTLDVLGWVMRRSRPEDFASFSSAASAILLAAYAVALAGWGIFARSAVDRMLGLGLIGIVIAKLYLYDVWLLGRVYRVAAFAILGLLLLAMSYLYSRYRASIENWVRVSEDSHTR